jgi:nucleoside-diphosphate-sugar epimerase
MNSLARARPAVYKTPMPPSPLPSRIETEEQLDDLLSAPPQTAVDAMRALGGDLLVLGIGGKMGPSLARMARRALDAAGSRARVVGVSRFGDGGLRKQLESWGIETIACDLLDGDALARLPRCPNVLYMPARKFGSAGAEWETWATNTFLAGDAARIFRDSRIAAFSTGNVYPLTPVASDGPAEDAPTGPVGEYAQSCLGRERMFEFFSRRHGTRVTILRLNYAVELRYGVLCDVARKIAAGEPVDLTMGDANVIWQGDANAYTLRAFGLCASPPAVLNLTGPRIRIRDVAERLGEALGRKPVFSGAEAPTALLSNPAKCHALFGPPAVPLDAMIVWTAGWVKAGGRSLGKPTKYQARDGSF